MRIQYKVSSHFNVLLPPLDIFWPGLCPMYGLNEMSNGHQTVPKSFNAYTLIAVLCMCCIFLMFLVVCVCPTCTVCINTTNV